jgi:hypothetical protein
MVLLYKQPPRPERGDHLVAQVFNAGDRVVRDVGRALCAPVENAAAVGAVLPTNRFERSYQRSVGIGAVAYTEPPTE